MIDLTGLSFAAVEASLLEFGGIQRGSLGGPSQNLQRLGNRFSFALALPPLPGRNPWTGKIVRAKQEGAIVRIPEPDFEGFAWPPAPKIVTAVAGGTTVTVGDLGAGFSLPSKWVTILHGGRRYIHFIEEEVLASDGGVAAVAITPMLRTPLVVGDLVQIAQPTAEGLLVDRLTFGSGKNRRVAFTLSLEEQR